MADTLRTLECKILLALTGGGGSGVTTGGVAAGTSTDPNALALAATVLIYNQFDSGGAIVAQWERNQNGVFI